MQFNRFISYQDESSQQRQLNSATCVVEAMKGASYIDILRNLESGHTTIQPSSLEVFQYNREGPIEELRGVKLEHSYACPALDKQMSNPDKPLRLCCCILLKHGNDFLATKRTSTISFPGAWVLPGGGVEGTEAVFEAGLRQCFEEVGREFNPKEASQLTHNNVMVWESHYVKDNHVHRGNFVVFITIPTEQFPVKVQKEEVEEYKWMDIQEASQQIIYNEKERQGFGEGHIRYLKLVNTHPKHSL